MSHDKTIEQIARELQQVVIDSQELLDSMRADDVDHDAFFAQASADYDRIRALRSELCEAGGITHPRLAEICEGLREAAGRVEQTIREHPVAAMAIAVGVGAFVGILLRRGR